jgi:hypothetical protein
MADRKRIAIGLMVVWQAIGAAGCNVSCKSERDLMLLWRESSGIAIEEVSTPAWFEVSPSKAVKPIMARMSRAAWADAYVFADGCNYYLGNGNKGEGLPQPLACPFVINGNTGKIVSGPY